MKKIVLLMLILVLDIFLGACNNKEENTDDNAIDVYYVNSENSTLDSVGYQLISTDTKEQIHELIYILQKAPDNALLKSALPSDNKIDFAFDEKTGYLTVYLDASFNELSNLSKILCRAAIVKTLSQLKGVQYSQFSVDGQANDPDDNAGGIYTANDFIDNIDEGTIYKLKLYFANYAGNALIEYTTDINYTGAQSIEEIAINQLINGPTQVGMYRTIPEGTVLLDVIKADGICTVDFNKKFLDKLPDIDENIAIYSVVNTLAELPDIDKVKFTIESEVQKTYWKDVPFNTTFDEKLDFIESPN